VIAAPVASGRCACWPRFRVERAKTERAAHFPGHTESTVDGSCGPAIESVDYGQLWVHVKDRLLQRC
jgi:hypothetical protein